MKRADKKANEIIGWPAISQINIHKSEQVALQQKCFYALDYILCLHQFKLLNLQPKIAHRRPSIAASKRVEPRESKFQINEISCIKQ